MSGRLSVGYISQLDPNDHRAWSGTVRGIAEAIRSAGADVHPIGPLHSPVTGAAVWRKLSAKVRRGHSLRDRDLRVVRSWARQSDDALRDRQIDCVLTPSTLPLAYATTELPWAAWTDASFAGMIDEYEASVRDGRPLDDHSLGRVAAFAGLDRATVRDGHAIEAHALAKIDAAIFSSSWARDTAVAAYDLDPDRAHVIPFGANIEMPPESVVESYLAARSVDRIELVFIGVIWEGKGGPLALETARLLNDAGIPTRLTVLGATPVLDGPAPEWLVPLGMVDKGTADGRAAFERAVASAHVLLFPTRFDAYGLAIAEANAYGVPAVAPRHAGPATIVRDGRNGVLLDRDASAADYRDAVLQMWSDRDAYEVLARSSYAEYSERLSWEAASSSCLEVLRTISAAPRAQTQVTRPEASRP